MSDPTTAQARMVYVLHGPNLNMLGKREVAIYGHDTLEAIAERLVARGRELGVEVTSRQSNHEGQLIDWVHEAFERPAVGLVINPAGYTHTSVALRDALAMLTCPKVEIHLSNVWQREAFRQHSHVSPVVDGVIGGFGPVGYEHALAAVVGLARERAGAGW